MRILKPLPGTLPMPGRPLADAVGLWPMNSLGKKIFDLSGNGNDGTLQATMSWSRGQFGSCLEGSGGASGDYIEFGSNSYWITQLSVFIWTYFDTFTELGWIIGKYYGTGNEREWIVRQRDISGSDCDIQLLFGDSADGTYEGAINTDNRVLTLNTWQLIGFTYNAGTVVVYVNGLEVTSSVVEGAIPFILYNGTAPFDIFGASGSEGKESDGKCDLPILYNRALSASEIALLCRESFCMFPENIMPEFGISA